jgi:hypothetical protein
MCELAVRKNRSKHDTVACSLRLNVLIVLNHLCSVACPMFYAFCVTFTRMSQWINVLLCDMELHVRLSLGIEVFLCDISCLIFF